MSRGPDAATRLERALLSAARDAGVCAEIAAADWQRWASVTFTGARHQLTLTAIACPAAHGWLAALPEHEFELGAHLVADLAVAAVRDDGEKLEIEIEALTVEAR